MRGSSFWHESWSIIPITVTLHFSSPRSTWQSRTQPGAFFIILIWSGKVRTGNLEDIVLDILR